MPGFFPESMLLSKSSIVSKIPKCGACGLYKTCKSPKMPVDGQGKRKILILGEAPGKNEDDKNRPFVGAAGQLLRDHLRDVGINMRKDCWITNSLICRPPKNKIVDEDNKIAYCRPNVFNTIEELKPEIILTLGRRAVKSLIGHIWKEDVGTMERWVGWKIPSQSLNSWICPTWHPSYLLRQRNERRDNVMELWFDRHLEAMSKLEGRPWEKVPNYESQVEVILDVNRAAAIIRKMIKKGGTASFDYETNMLKPDNPKRKIVCCAISWEGKKTIAYPWGGEAVKATREFLKSDVKKVGFNTKFEDRWSQEVLGCWVRNWEWCGMITAHILDCRKEICSLKFQSFIRAGVPSYDDYIKPFLKAKSSNSMNRINEIELRKLLLYCGTDALLEFMVYVQQRKEIFK